MAFNYLQTDDRDDFFKKFRKEKKKKEIGIRVVDSQGNIIFDCESREKVKHYAKKYLLPGEFKRYWRDALKRNGYKVTTIYL